MKRLIFCLSALLLLAACKGKQPETSTTVADTATLPMCNVLSEMDDMEVIAIPDRLHSMSADLFKGSFNDSLLAVLTPDGSTPSAINAFLLRISGNYSGTRDYTVLIDAGLGEDNGGLLLRQLKFLDVKPEEIDAICLTHLHPDHIGGLLKGGQPLFLNAEIYLSVDEFNAWSDDGPFASKNELWKQLLSSYANNIRLFNDGDKILEGSITAHLAPGHTPGHTVYEAGLCLFVGDLLHAQDLQLEHPDFCARYDDKPSLAVQTRKRILASASGLYLCGAHCYDPFISM